jgi:hypothetical protein
MPKASEAFASRELHILCFVKPVNKRVASTFEMAAGKWTHFDPPRDRAEFGPMVENGSRSEAPADIGQYRSGLFARAGSSTLYRQD